MTEQQQKVTVGQVVTLKHGFGKRTVLLVCDDGLLTIAGTDKQAPHFWPWDEVILPEPPKAKPGVRYRIEGPTGNQDGVGSTDGRVWAFGISSVFIVPFTDQWREVAE